MAGVEEKVKQRLADQGSLSAGDLSGFAKTEAKEEKQAEPAKPDPLAETSQATVPKEAANDPALANEIEDNDRIAEALRNDPAGLTTPLADVEITADEKARFIDTLVKGGRFELPFSLYNGTVNGVFRSRTTRETRAILGELYRELQAGEFQAPDEYPARMRHAILRFQVQELQGKEYPAPEEPLMATVTTEDPLGKKPGWVEEAETFFGSDQQEALVTAVYEALRLFEQKYWAMVQHAGDQDFWQTEGSTSA